MGSGALKSFYLVAKAFLNPSKHEFLTNRNWVNMMGVKFRFIQSSGTFSRLPKSPKSLGKGLASRHGGSIPGVQGQTSACRLACDHYITATFWWVCNTITWPPADISELPPRWSDPFSVGTTLRPRLNPRVQGGSYFSRSAHMPPHPLSIVHISCFVVSHPQPGASLPPSTLQPTKAALSLCGAITIDGIRRHGPDHYVSNPGRLCTNQSVSASLGTRDTLETHCRNEHSNSSFFFPFIPNSLCRKLPLYSNWICQHYPSGTLPIFLIT